MLGFLKTFTTRTLIILNSIAFGLMFVAGYVGHITPVSHPILSNIGMAFGPILLVNVGFLVLWIFVKPRMVWLPVLGFIFCYSPIRAYIPFNVPEEKPENAIKVLSYNVFLFDTWDVKKGEPNPIVEYIVKSDADIACLQEATMDTPDSVKLWKRLKEHYRYTNLRKKKKPGQDHLILLSNFPILWSEEIPYPSWGNMSVAYMLDIRGVKTLVVNNHFESYHLNEEDKQNFKTLVKGDIITERAKKESGSLLVKLGRSTAKRAPQAEAVAQYIRKYLDKGIPVIACGDFNDHPVSYTCHTIGTVLNDCYVASGNGPGFSYHRNGMFFRIDHIFASNNFKAYGAKVDSSIPYSDHYPIYTWLSLRR